MRHGFGVYYYANNDIYEGSWKKNLRHGMGTYLYANIETKFMGTWVDDRMQGPGQLVHERHRFHGFWKSNLVHEIYEIKIEKKIFARCIGIDALYIYKFRE